jgi:hypothetical protein
LKENGNPGLIDGYTPEQRFFMCGRPSGGLKQEMQHQEQVTDPHSPGMYRAYVPLQNVDTSTKLLISNQMMECTPQKTELKSGSRNMQYKLPSESLGFFLFYIDIPYSQ